MTTNKPIKEYRFGNVRASLWANEAANGVRYSVNVTRSYKKDGVWKTSESFSRDEIPQLLRALEAALGFMEAQVEQS